MDEQMREKFEAWAKPNHALTESAWAAWQACAAALSQPAAQGDSSHPAGGECGGVTQPLTDEQIIEIRKDCYSRTPITTPWTDCIKFARAILAATKAAP